MTQWNIFEFYEIHKFVEQLKPVIQNLANARISASLAKVEEILDHSDVKHSLEAFQRAKKFTDSELLDRWTDLYYALCVVAVPCVGANDQLMCAILENELDERGMGTEMDRVIQEASPHLEEGPFDSDGASCGDWCALFEEPEAAEAYQGNWLLNLDCGSGGVKVFSEFIDEHGEKKG